jgi:hypothetical protein
MEMSRSGYSDDCTSNSLNVWRGAVASALRGKRGQSFLREFIETLDAMPVKELAAHSFQDEDGKVCALGSVCVARGVPMTGFIDGMEEMDRDKVGSALNIAPAMAAEIVWMNDEGTHWRCDDESGAARWKRMRAWAVENLVKP